MIAFYGMGLLGSNFVRALRRRGESVRIWNRTHARAAALAETGASPFEDPAEAARGAARIHLTLSDDAAVDDVLERARPGFGADVLVVDHTTTSPTVTVTRAALWRERGVRFVHAPVFMGPQNALNGTGSMLVSGDPALVSQARPILEPMTGKVVELGDRVDAAASFKLLGNLFLMFVTTGLADMFALGKALGIPAADARGLFEFFNPGTSVPVRAERMASGDYTRPSWELAMAAKDARIMLEEADRANVPLAALPAIFTRMNELMARGHGHDDWCVLGKDAV